MNIGIAIGTYGDKKPWIPLIERAIHSIQSQSHECKYQWVHAESLHDARNQAAQKLIEREADWLVFLDADDELEEDFVINMTSEAHGCRDKYPIFSPAVRNVIDGTPQMDITQYPVPEHPRDLVRQNRFCIGAMHRASMFTEIGGFADWEILEDWAYWLDAMAAGATAHASPHAVYRAHTDSQRKGRNTVSAATDIKISSQIRAKYSFLNN